MFRSSDNAAQLLFVFTASLDSIRNKFDDF